MYVIRFRNDRNNETLRNVMKHKLKEHKRNINL